MVINEGFLPKRPKNDRLPPGQYETKDFPVLSLGPTPLVEKDNWVLKISGLVKEPKKWNWEEFLALPHHDIIRDIHCVTKWSKFDTDWSGVFLQDIFNLAGVREEATHLLAFSSDGYSTNLPLLDVLGEKAMVATKYRGEDILPEHGGPARLLVPHLYFWKSAKWLEELKLIDHDEPGFWEVRGYHNYGDPWLEQRYTND
jgi:DMSO/TMAO reductase YedYZ molybdopterin-dependent catalytic subunit